MAARNAKPNLVFLKRPKCGAHSCTLANTLDNECNEKHIFMLLVAAGFADAEMFLCASVADDGIRLGRCCRSEHPE